MSAVTHEPAADLAHPPSSANGLEAWSTSADPAYCRDGDGRILAANLSFARKFGRLPAAIPELRVADLLHSEDLRVLEASTAELRHPPHHAVVEHRWVTPQGIRWFAWEEQALLDPDGAMVSIRAVGRDITRQRLAEEQFSRLSRAVEQSPVSIVITDLDGHAQYVNPKFTAVSGHTLEDVLDRNVEVLRDGHPDPVSYEKFWNLVRAGGEWRGELSTHRRDGSTIWEAVKVSSLRGPTGEITNFLCLREDVTERKKLEHELRQAQKMESLGTLAGGIAHDFNNLLAIINGYAELCQQGVPNPAILQKSLREIHRASQRAIGLVRQILTFSRKTEVRYSAVDVNHLARELATMLSETFPRTVTIRVDAEAGLPPLLADQNQLQQILLNLCVNARDAMPAGGTITLTTRAQPGAALRSLGADPACNYACLTVSDTGTGISPDVRPRIFEPFFTTKASHQGTGLGLAVVYGIVVAHHGFIEVDSTPGVGSTFRIYLPLAETAVAAPPAPSADFAGGVESLLIVDDEESLRSLLCTVLSEKGYVTVGAASGLEAIELLGDPARVFSAVLLDLNMPGASGIDVLKFLRLCRPTVPVMVVSGHISPQARAEFERLGQRVFVQKPYSLHEVGSTLRDLLDNRIA